MTFQRDLVPRERTMKPYGYGFEEVFPCSGPKLGAETALDGRDDQGPELRGLLVGERLLARLEGHGEGDRLLPRADLLAAVDVERPHLPQVGAGRLARCLHERSGGHILGDDESEILPDGRIGD